MLIVILSGFRGASEAGDFEGYTFGEGGTRRGREEGNGEVLFRGWRGGRDDYSWKRGFFSSEREGEVCIYSEISMGEIVEVGLLT